MENLFTRIDSDVMKDVKMTEKMVRFAQFVHSYELTDEEAYDDKYLLDVLEIFLEDYE